MSELLRTSENPGISPDLLQRAAAVRLVFFDIDGVFTDGGLFFDKDGEAIKRFSTLDGHGVKLIQEAKIIPAVISGRDSPALRRRLDGLGIRHAVLGQEDKLPAAENVLRSLGLTWKDAAAMGDDWPDLPLLVRCTLACAPVNAHAELRVRAHFVCQTNGGHGAVRELCDLLLQAQGFYTAQLARYLTIA